jgi:DNA-binding LytR/AlgR family response regulator
MLLKDNISKVPFLHLVATCENAFEALQVIQEQTIHLIFIDIQMPGLSGLQFISSLEHPPLVIFVTAYKEYAADSYDLAVVDYLVKSVALDRFMKACIRAQEILHLKHQQIASPNRSNTDYFFVQADYSQVKVDVNDIIYIEGLGDYLKIFLMSSDRPLVIRSSLKNILQQLPADQFLRIHKSFIVALLKIQAVRKNSITVAGIELPIGETYRDELEKFIRK